MERPLTTSSLLLGIMSERICFLPCRLLLLLPYRGDVLATDTFTTSVQMMPARSGAEVEPVVSVTDGFGQLVRRLDGSAIVVSCPEPVLGKVTTGTYTANKPLAGITVAGNVSQQYTLQFTVTAPALPAPLVAAGNTTVLECEDGQEFNLHTLTCECRPGFFTSSAANSCSRCPAGFVSTQRGSLSCFSCPSATYSSPDGTECLSCPLGATSPRGSTSVLDCSCPYGQFSRSALPPPEAAVSGDGPEASGSSNDTIPAAQQPSANSTFRCEVRQDEHGASPPAGFITRAFTQSPPPFAGLPARRPLRQLCVSKASCPRGLLARPGPARVPVLRLPRDAL